LIKIFESAISVIYASSLPLLSFDELCFGDNKVLETSDQS